MAKRLILLMVMAAVTAASAFAQMQPVPGRAGGPVFARDLANGLPIIGFLGVPLGHLVSIRAHTVESGSLASPARLAITEVDGSPLAASIEMDYTIWPWGNLGGTTLAPDTTMALRVYETGGMQGVPIEAMKETRYVQTADWGFHSSIVVLYRE